MWPGGSCMDMGSPPPRTFFKIGLEGLSLAGASWTGKHGPWHGAAGAQKRGGKIRRKTLRKCAGVMWPGDLAGRAAQGFRAPAAGDLPRCSCCNFGWYSSLQKRKKNFWAAASLLSPHVVLTLAISSRYHNGLTFRGRRLFPAPE